MGSLTSCFKAAGDKLDASDRAAILARAKALRDGGMASTDASRQAVDERLAEVRGMIAGFKPDGSKAAPETNTSAEPVEAVDTAPETAPEPAGLAPMPAVIGIPREAAQNAHRNTSHIPEQRALQEQSGFMSALRDAWDRAALIAGTDPAAIDRITEVFADVADGYRARTMRTLDARSRTASAMITGPAKFPTERNRKRMETEHRRAEEASEYLARGIKRLVRAARGPIDNSPESELERVRLNLSQREETQDAMKAANAALRKKDFDALLDLGFSEQDVATLQAGKTVRRVSAAEGFPSYMLANNSAEIRRLRERLADAEDRMQAAQEGPKESTRAGVRMVEDAQDDRLRLYFEGKPSDEVRTDLKASGFKWSPNAGAWQRQLTDNAVRAANEVLARHFPEPDPKLSRAPAVRVKPDGSGKPTYHTDALSLDHPLPAVRMDAVNGDGYTTENYAIMAPDGRNSLGHVVLYMKDGAPVALLDLQVYDKRAGVGRQAVETILAAHPDADITISNIVPEARGFWAKMGVPTQYLEEGAHYDGTINWQTYSDANPGAAGGVAQAIRGAGQGPDTGAAGSDGSQAQERLKRGGPPGIPLAQAQAIVDKLGPDVVKLNVVQSVEDMPSDLRGKVLAKTPSGKIRGAYFKGNDSVWLVADNLHSPEEFVFVALHEAFHRGMAKTIGTEAKQLLRVMRLTNGKLRRLADEQMERHGIGLDEAIEEALADLAGKGEVRDLRGWSKLLALVKGWLQRAADAAGITIRWTDDMVSDFVAGITREGLTAGVHVNTGTTGAAETATLSRADGSTTTAQDLVTADGGVFDFNRLGATRQDRIRTIVDGGRPFFLAALTRDQIADIWGDEIAPVKEYDKLTRAMENQRSKIAQDADVLYGEWSKLGTSTNDKLAGVMLDATVNSVHPDGEFNTIKGNDAATETQRKAVHARLSTEFRALPAEAQAMYSKVRDFHSGTLEQLKASLEKRIERQVQDGKARAATLTHLRKMFDQYTAAGPYFPLSRFGDYLVIGNRADGERVVASYETSGEQQAAARALRKDGFTVKTKAAKQYTRSLDGSAGRFAGDVLTMLNDLDLSEATVNGKGADLKTQLMDDVNQLFIRALPDLSYRKHFAHRKNTPGFSSDVMRGFASSAFHAANHIARLNHSDQMSFALEDAFKAVDRMEAGDFNTHTQVLNELARRHDAVMNPNTHPLAAMLNQVGFVMYLGASPAAGLIQLLQNPMITLPYLGARHGFGKAAAAMGKASKDILGAKANRQSGWNAADSPKLTQAERDTMRKLQDEGVIDLTQAHDLAAATDLDTGSVARSKGAFAMSRAMKIVGWTFHVPEVMNRQVAALTAYRLEMEKSGDQAAAEEAAREAIKRTHFDYSSSNRARYMQGNVARVMLQFKSFSQNMTYLLGRAAYLALKGESPEVKAIARRQLVATLATTFVMSGTLGLPGLGMVAGLIGMLVGALDDDDKPWDWKTEFRNLAADATGKELGEVLSHGVPRALMPWDIANRVGLGDLWLRSNDREGQSPRESFATDMTNILGPTAGTLLGLYTASDHMARGNWGKAAESIVPKFLRDPIQAARMSTEGVTSYSGEHLMDLTAAESLGKLLGFVPASVSEMYEGKNAVKNAETAVMDKRKLLIARAAHARMEGDADGSTEAMADIQAFNKRNPREAINGSSIAASILARRRHERQTQDGTYLPKKRDHLREIGRFATAE